MGVAVADQIMPRKNLTVEFYVGVFAIIGMACLGYLAMNIAGMKILESGFYEITAEFDNISGLESGANVEIAGVPIGEVRQIDLNGTSAIVTLKIRDSIPLRTDDIAAIRTKGIIGERYIKVIPGGTEEKVARGGKMTETESALEFEEIIGKIIHRME